MPATMPVEPQGRMGVPRPQHKRNQSSSKAAILRALLGAESSPARNDAGSHVERSPAVLGERHGNMQSQSSSPSKGSTKRATTSKKYPRLDLEIPNKSGSMRKMAVEVSTVNSPRHNDNGIMSGNKENDTPPSSSHGQAATPIWAQFATSNKAAIADEIALYTPQDYNPGMQRNFNGSLDAPSLRPRLGRTAARPQSGIFSGSEGIVSAIGRRVSGGRQSMENRSSEDSGSRRIFESRKASGSSSDHPQHTPLREKLNITKRGGRVMAAVAALQGKARAVSGTKQQPAVDAKAIDEAFEAVLEARNIPEAQRQKMRTLTLRVKADFVRQDQSTSKTPHTSPPGTLGPASKGLSNTASSQEPSMESVAAVDNDDAKSTKRTRTRSRTFTFSKGDRSGERTPAKKQRGHTRALSSFVPSKDNNKSSGDQLKSPTTPNGSLGRKSAPPAYPADYISYLKCAQDPTKTEVGKLHKLRLLLRNETVAWVDTFISLGGMTEIVNLLDRIMAIEWREDHEDQLLHETLLCLKGLCTTERAMVELDNCADTLFPKLLGMLFDEEKKGPAEYATRTIIINVLFNFLSSATKNRSPAELEKHAQRILSFLGEPATPEDAQPVDFVREMHIPRPYKLWCSEVSHVAKEVFWIFLHNLNVIARPKSADGVSDAPESTSSMAPFTARHFPGARPPVPAAPYIGGVEWDATTYMAAHLDLLNGLIASHETCASRNALREQLRACGFEKLMGGSLRTCKEKFYSCVHDGLRAWVAAAIEDGWETMYVREGPNEEESPTRSPAKQRKDDAPAPKLEALPALLSPKLDLGDDDGWLG